MPLSTAAKQYYELKERVVGADQMRFLERFIMLRTIDEKWRDHLYDMDQLKEGINWRAYGQKRSFTGIQRRGIQGFRGNDWMT
jgi:preprotein translocase subunit SecA